MDKNIARKIFENKVGFSYGKRGVISTSEFEGRKYVVKEKRLDSDSLNGIKNEFVFNKKLNELGIGPKVYFYDEEKDFLIRDFVEGEALSSFFERSDLIEIKKVVSNILDQCRVMDLNNVNKFEMTNPYKDILVAEKPYIIDFERCRFSRKPKNVTQFLQYLTRPRNLDLFNKKGLYLEKSKIIELGEKYKEIYEEEKFEELKEFILPFSS